MPVENKKIIDLPLVTSLDEDDLKVISKNGVASYKETRQQETEYFRSNIYSEGTNIEITAGGVINNTFSLPSDINSILYNNGSGDVSTDTNFTYDDLTGKFFSGTLKCSNGIQLNSDQDNVLINATTYNTQTSLSSDLNFNTIHLQNHFDSQIAGSFLILSRTRGTQSSPLPLNDEEIVGGIYGAGITTSGNLDASASITIQSDGSPTATSAPSKITQVVRDISTTSQNIFEMRPTGETNLQSSNGTNSKLTIEYEDVNIITNDFKINNSNPIVSNNYASAYHPTYPVYLQNKTNNNLSISPINTSNWVVIDTLQSKQTHSIVFVSKFTSGTGYAVNDELVISSGLPQKYDEKCKILVTSVDGLGSINTFSIINQGKYFTSLQGQTVFPDNLIGSGSNAAFEVLAVSVQDSYSQSYYDGNKFVVAEDGIYRINASISFHSATANFFTNNFGIAVNIGNSPYPTLSFNDFNCLCSEYIQIQDKTISTSFSEERELKNGDTVHLLYSQTGNSTPYEIKLDSVSVDLRRVA